LYRRSIEAGTGEATKPSKSGSKRGAAETAPTKKRAGKK
jgi:hypothetical protein